MTKGLTQILTNLKRYVELSPADEEAFATIVRYKKIKKKQFIVQPDFVCSSQTYVLQGAFRAYYVNENGVEHTIQLAIEDWFISDFNSYINQLPASLFVEAIEASEILELPYGDVEELCVKHPVFERYFRIVAQKAFAFSQQRILASIGATAEQRYLEFKKMYPEMFQRVPQYMLASYLGITPEFMSALKKNIDKKGRKLNAS